MIAIWRRVSPSSLLLVAILILGACLRCWGLSFGLPNPEVRPDETAVVGVALLMTYAGLNPHFFHWPSLELYVLAGIYRLEYTIGRRVFHIFHRNFDLLRDAAAVPGRYLMVPRVLSVMAGIATIWIVYRVARDLFDRATARAAAFFVAVAFLHVRDSHFGLIDVPMTLFVVAAMVPLQRVFVDPTRLRDWVLAGVLAGLAASTKYNGGVMVAVGIATATMAASGGVERGRWPQVVRGLCAFLVASGLAFVAGTPYSVLDSSNFLEGLRFDSEHFMEGHGITLERGWTHHLTFSLWYGLGAPLLLTAIAGILLMALRSWRKAVMVCTFPILYYLLIGRGYTVFVRYVEPVVPFLCIAAAFAVMEIVRRATPSKGVAGVLAGIVAVALATPSLQRDIEFDRLISRPDTRLLALAWLDAHRQPSDWIVEESPAVLHSTFIMQPPSLHLARFDEERSAFLSPENDVVSPEWVVLPRAPLAAYMHQPTLLIPLVSSGYTLAATFMAGTGSESPMIFDEQDMFLVPYADFSQRERSGPDIYIYRRTLRSSR